MKRPKVMAIGRTSASQNGHSCRAMNESVGGLDVAIAAIVAAVVAESCGSPSNSTTAKIWRSCRRGLG